MKLVVATRNAGKVRELQVLLTPLGYELVSLEAAGVRGEVEEDALSFAGNAEKKAKAAFFATGLTSVADDSGLEVDALGGAPGVQSARFAVPSAGETKDAANNARLLHELSDIPSDLRSARFRCALCLILPTGRRVTAQGACEGRIATAPRGNEGFGYDPLFEVTDGGLDGARTMAQLTSEEKNQMSHRAKALAGLQKALSALA